jgi:hypothetical protein
VRVGWVGAIGLWWQAGIHGRVLWPPRGVPARLLEQDLERIRQWRRGLDGGCVHLLPNGMDGALNPGRQACAEIEVAGRRRGRVAGFLKKVLGQKAAVDLADADWADSRALVESHQLASHERLVGGPWRRLVGQPFGDAGQYVSKDLGSSPKRRSQFRRSTALVPPGPAAPESFDATRSTTSPVISTGTGKWRRSYGSKEPRAGSSRSGAGSRIGGCLSPCPGRVGWVGAIGLWWQAGIHGCVFSTPR